MYDYSLHLSDQRPTVAPPSSTTTPPPLPSPSTVHPPENNPHGACAAAPSATTASLPDDKHEEALPRYKRDLVAKMKILRTELQTMQPQSGHCRLEVSRAEIFEVLFAPLHFI